MLYSRNVTALSIPMLIAIPVVIIAWIGIVFFVTNSPWFGWYRTQALQATVLFRCLDEEMRAHSPTNSPADGDAKRHAWTQDLNSYFSGDSDQPTCIRPKFEMGTKALIWEKTTENENKLFLNVVEDVSKG